MWAVNARSEKMGIGVEHVVMFFIGFAAPFLFVLLMIRRKRRLLNEKNKKVTS